MNRKAVMIAVLSALMLVAMVSFVSAKGAPEQTTGMSQALKDIGFHTSGFPIVDKKVTVTVLARKFAPITDFINNDFTKWYEAKTNVHLNWDLVPDADVVSKVSTVLASGDLPDFFMVPWGISLTQQAVYGAQGVFIPLNNYIKEYGPHYQKMLSDYPLMRSIITQADGKIYTMPNLDDFYEGKLPQKAWVWKPWLDALGISIPQTTADFEKMLLAFKNKDPNNNGKADEIPLSGYLGGNAATYAGTATFVPYIMNAFVYDGGDGANNYAYLDNGKVVVPFNQPGWREGIRYMHKLYQEGLFTNDVFTQDANTFRQANTNQTLTGTFVDLVPWRAFTELYNNDRWQGWRPIPPLTGPSGMKVATYYPYAIGWFDGLIITSAAKYPEVIFRWGEEMYSQEITLRKYYGRENYEWRYAKPGEIGINGKPAIWASLAKSGGEIDFPTSHSWMHVGPHYRSADFRDGQAVSGDLAKNPNGAQYKYTKEAYDPYKANTNMILPPLVLTEDQATELSDLRTTINTYVNESLARFITGEANIETGWDSYLNDLTKMNLTRYIQILQQAYDAKYGKK